MSQSMIDNETGGLLNWDIDEPLTCPHCNSQVYCMVLLYDCCDVAREQFAKTIEKAITSESMSYHTIVKIGPNDVDD